MTESGERRFIRIISGAARGVGPSLARASLAAIEPVYRGVTSVRNFAFDRGLKAVHRIDRPVISVGNLTTGGTGKTPVVAWLVDVLRKKLNVEIGILIRGYKSREGDSDEARLLESLLADPRSPAARVLVGADRIANARSAIAAQPQIATFVMDDGFQHRRLHRDFDLLLVDATNPFGFDHVLPRGLLRESVAGLRRAHAVLITKADQVEPESLLAIRRRVEQFNPNAPVFESAHVLSGFRRVGVPAGEMMPLQGKRISAFAGIGNPQSFAEMLRRGGCNLVGDMWFPDHHHYTENDFTKIAANGAEHRAEAIVTTAKDAVKLPADTSAFGAPLLVAELRIDLGDDAERLADRIIGRITRKTT